MCPNSFCINTIEVCLTKVEGKSMPKIGFKMFSEIQFSVTTTAIWVRWAVYKFNKQINK